MSGARKQRSQRHLSVALFEPNRACRSVPFAWLASEANSQLQNAVALGGDPGAQRDLRRQLSVNLDDVRLGKLGCLGDRVVPSSVGVFADIWNRGHALGSRHSEYNGPVLIVRGGDDAFVTEEIVSDTVIPRFTNPTVVSVDGAGHWPHVEQPQAVATILDAFLTNPKFDTVPELTC